MSEWDTVLNASRYLTVADHRCALRRALCRAERWCRRCCGLSSYWSNTLWVKKRLVQKVFPTSDFFSLRIVPSFKNFGWSGACESPVGQQMTDSAFRTTSRYETVQQSVDFVSEEKKSTCNKLVAKYVFISMSLFFRLVRLYIFFPCVYWKCRV